MKRFTLYLLLATLAVTTGVGCKEKPKKKPTPPNPASKVVCGDNNKAESEECDDGNTIDGDGCSATCEIEDGYDCSSGSCTIKLCGNSTVDTAEGEDCDDGNTIDGDGCSATCQTETGYTCNSAGQLCVKNSERVGCGNSKLDTSLGEECDDGNQLSNDGCSATCKLETGFRCETPGQSCVNLNTLCGNGKVDTADGEECDFNAPGAPPECMQNCKLSHCGNGVREGKETCDDGNKRAGDGCSAGCQVEKGWICEPQKACVNQNCGNGKQDLGEECDAGAANNDGRYNGCRVNCTLAPHCGDGFLSPGNGEECDDGNKVDGDGCSSTCTIEGAAGEFDCSRPGRPCIQNKCGDGTLDLGEYCDDGNRASGDGCDDTCHQELGFTCTTPGQPCVARACGDGILAGSEECDDGNLRNNDGCNQYCEIESGFYCPTPGQACVTPTCGNGTLEPTEDCDDGNTNDHDGCSAKCKFEAGFKCPTVGAKCVKAICGDGVREGYETCDDGNKTSGDGCSYSTDETTACQVEPGWTCEEDSSGHSACKKTVCGDGKQEGDEECDDGNNWGGDGCTPDCKAENVFDCRRDKNGKTVCGPTCGDGVTLTKFGEECDDGNKNAGDGCSPDCKIEPGFECTVTGTPTGTPGQREFKIPMVIRDFKIYDWKNDGAGHRDFGRRNKLNKHTCMGGPHGTPHLLQDRLGPDGKPVLAATTTCFGTVAKGLAGLQHDEKHEWAELWFYRWYHDSEKSGSPNTYAKRLTYNLHFKEVPGRQDTYVNLVPDPKDPDNESKLRSADTNDFFPIDGRGWGDVEDGHNFYFTTEFTSYFTYKGGETLDFIGDDDLWVFINGRLAVDMGGLNESATGSVSLSNAIDPVTNRKYDSKFDLYQGGVYEIKVFHAERHITQSKYKLTLSGFVSFGISQCAPKCGDGVVAYGHEECDAGSNNSDAQSGGKYTSGCSTQCTTNPGWFCKGSPSVCNITECGDGTVQYPEQCDLGSAKNDGTACRANCTLPNCGDGNVQSPEECDFKATGADPRCTVDCRLSVCGDAIVEANEECDDGNKDNDDGCTNTCKLPICGDGIVQPTVGERCDGINDGQYGAGHCTLDCQGVAPYCGDNIVQTDKGEECDEGSANGTTSGYDACSADCKFVFRCGDGKLDSPSEQCDDGNDVDGDGCSNCRIDPGYYCCTSKDPDTGECLAEKGKVTTCSPFG